MVVILNHHKKHCLQFELWLPRYPRTGCTGDSQALDDYTYNIITVEQEAEAAEYNEIW